MITLYYGSGSPYAWRVQLALEAKGLPYDRKVLSFAAGDTKKPEFVALNPRHRVPTIVDGGFTLYESNAIVEYLDESYKGRGTTLFPGDAKKRATVRRLISEVDGYTTEAVDNVVKLLLYVKPEERDAAKIDEARAAMAEELAFMAKYIEGEYLVRAEFLTTGTSVTGVQFARALTATTNNHHVQISWEVVTLNDGSTVQTSGATPTSLRLVISTQ